MPEKILIVEDNPQNMRLMEMILRGAGYSLLKAVDGPSALETARSEVPDLIIMDIQLPRMSGTELIARLRQLPEFEWVPIIAVTAYAMKGDKERLLGAGCDAYVSKPVNTRELPKLVADVLRSKRILGRHG